MTSSKLPIDSLPVWASLNNVHSIDVKVCALGEKGQGVVSTAPISQSDGTADPPVLVKVPHEVVLCEDVLDGYAKGDHRLMELFDAVKPQVSQTSKWHANYLRHWLIDNDSQVFENKDSSLSTLAASSDNATNALG